jgi:hypothetical protein
MIDLNELHEVYDKYNAYQKEHVDNWLDHSYWDGVKNSHEEMSDIYFTKFAVWLREIGQ